jgi:LysR family hydrogen peroxide-inducible transcriptional activator
VLRQADVALQAARNARDRQIGRVRVGYLADSQPSTLPLALSRYATAAPGIELALRIGHPAKLIDDVRRGLLDVAVVCLPAPAGGLRVTWLGIEGATVAVPEALARDLGGPVQPAQVAETPMIMLPRAMNPPFHDGVIATWRAAGVTARPVEATEPRVEHALLAVAAGSGIAVLPESAADRYSVPGVRFLPLEPTPTCEVAAITRDEASAPVAALLRLARGAARPADDHQVRRLAAASVAAGPRNG